MKTLTIEFEESLEFQKDLKRLKKRFRSLSDDLEILKSTSLHLLHGLNQPNNGIERMDGLGISEPKIFKVRKFACKALKGKGAMSGIRVIYAWFADLKKIEFIEMYYKGDKENEDRSRIHQKRWT